MNAGHTPDADECIHLAGQRPRTPRQRPPCGTASGYRSHLWYGETPCDPCKAAHPAYKTEWRRQRGAA